MIYLDYLQLKAFRSFVDVTTFNFPRDGLILINGKNLQTNDASGTGKSSVFLGVAYVLNILPEGVVAATLQSFLTKDKVQAVVGLDCSVNGKIVVARGKETFIEYLGKRYEGATLVNDHIEKVFGLSKEMLFTMAYRPQRSDGLFLTKNDTEKKEFLTALLGLDKIEAAIDSADIVIKTLTKELISIDAQITTKEDSVKQLNIVDTTALVEANAKLSAEILDFQADKERLELKLTGETKAWQDADAAITKKYDGLKSKTKFDIDILKSLDNNRKLVVEATNIETLNEIKTFRDALVVVDINKSKLASLQKEVASLTNDECPTCERSWDDADIKLKAVNEQIDTIQKIVSAESNIKDQIDFKTRELLVFEPDHRLPKLVEKLSTYDDQARGERVIGAGTGTMNMIHKDMHAIAGLTEKFMKNKVQIEKNQELKTLSVSIINDLGKLKALKTKKEATVQLESDFVKVLGKEGFLGSIFDEVLAEIVQVINTKLSTVANMSTVTFDFKTEVLNTKGVVKKSIVPMVTILGHESKISALSGGMLSSLELITDLAVKEVIERRTGKEIGFYFTDEAFNGQGQPTKEACLEILKTSASKKAFYIIDHHSEFKELFTQVIDIEMENGISKVK